MPQSLARLYVHLVFSTKQRRACITPALQPPLHAYIAGVLNAMACPAIEVGGVADHVHILCEMHRTKSVAQIIEEVKTTSSKWIKTQDPNLSDFAWQGGYAAFSVSESMRGKVAAYIQDQAQHHEKHDFSGELLALLRKHGIVPDERYLWD